MVRKIFAIALSLVIISSVFCVSPVGAEDVLPVSIGADFIPGAITGNMVTSGTNGVVGTAWGGDFTYGYNGHPTAGSVNFNVQSENYYYFKVMGSDVENPIASLYHNPVSGFNIKTTPTPGAKGNVVYSLTMKANTSPVAVVNMGRRNTTYASSSEPLRIEYPIEYNGPDKGVTPTSGYKTYIGTFKDTGAPSDKYQYAFGFVVGSKVGALAWFDTSATYIGYEYPYDISVTAQSTHLTSGGTLTADADILNQIGKVGAFSQDVTWYVTNKSRTKAMTGFNITSGANGNVTVSADNTVLSGTYALIAVYNENEKMVKGIEITVSGRDFSDFVPGPVKGNTAVVSNSSGALLGSNYQPFDLTTVGTVNAGKEDEAWTLQTIEDTPEIIIGANGMGAAGASFRKSNYGADELLVAGKNIVIGAKVRAQRGTPTIQASMYQYGIDPTFPIEYPEGKKLVGSEWQDFTATFHIPENGWKGARNTHFYIGYGYTGLVDECERILAIKKNSVYIGEEYAYDIKVTSDTKSCAPGRTSIFTVDSDIVNQLGSTGYLDQSVTWFALNDERTSYADGITVIGNDDGSATVTVADTVAEGTYDIVAASDKYDGLQKGVSIKVKNPYEDYVAGPVTGNWINCDVSTTDVLYPTWYPADFTEVKTIDDGTDNEAWVVASSRNVENTVLDVNGLGVGGAGINREYFNAAENLSAGKHVVIGAKVKATKGSPKIKTSMYHLQSTPIFPVEYPNAKDCFSISGGSWQDFGATLKIPETGWRGYEHTLLYIGFPYTGSLWDGSRGFAVKKNSFYIGEEYPYDIRVSADTTEWTEGKSTAIKVKADVVNQVGTHGYLNQNVTWHVLDATRTYEVADATITENSDGTATVKIGETVPTGVYDIVAVSDGYEEFVKGVRIRVNADEAATERVTVFELKEKSGTATLTAAVADTNAESVFFAVASYDSDDKMIKASIISAPVKDGVAIVRGLSLEGIVAGQRVRGYVWENKTLRPISLAKHITSTEIQK